MDNYTPRKSNVFEIEKLSQLFKYTPKVKIDPYGEFKYILIQVDLRNSKKEVLDTAIFLRGSGSFAYHDGIFKNF